MPSACNMTAPSKQDVALARPIGNHVHAQISEKHKDPDLNLQFRHIYHARISSLVLAHVILP